MCGILGFITDKPNPRNYAFFKKLLVLSQDRGKDATGIAYPYKNGIVIEKEPMMASKFAETVLPKHKDIIQQANICIGHTRAPTVGSPEDNNNNHPVYSDNWVMVHNGSCTQMDRLKDYKYKGEVDSEVLVSYVERYGLVKGLPHLGRGTAAIAAINQKELGAIYLWKEVSPLWIALDNETNTLFFASTDTFLSKSLANRYLLFSSFQIREVPSNVLLRLTWDPFDITYLGTVAVEYTSCNNNYYNRNYNVYTSMKFDSTTNRWNTSEYDAQIKKKTEAALLNDAITETDDKDTDGISMLKDLGFTPSEIAKLTVKSRKEIVDKQYIPEDILIYTNGTFGVRDGQQAKNCKVKIIDYTKFSTKTRWYIGISRDTLDWIKLHAPNRGYASMDGEVIKKWDKEHNSHYLIELDNAIEEGLIPSESGFLKDIGN